MGGDYLMTENNLHCPECGNLVTKAGGAWSGRSKFQQYKCQKCGRATIRPLDSKGNKVAAKRFNQEAK